MTGQQTSASLIPLGGLRARRLDTRVVIGPRRAPGPCWRCKHSLGADFSVGYGGGPTQQAGRTVSFTGARVTRIDSDVELTIAERPRPAGWRASTACSLQQEPGPLARPPHPLWSHPIPGRHGTVAAVVRADFTIYQTQPLDYVR